MKKKISLLCAVVILVSCIPGLWAQAASSQPVRSKEISSSLLAKAKAGDAQAQYRLGKMYYDGDDVSQNYPQAALWFRRAAEQGNPDAEYMLGGLYHYGLGVPKNSAKSIIWLEKAAGQGQAKADYLLATCYSAGWGVGKNDAEAVSWLRKGAALENENSEYMLGWAYERGIGVQRDYGKAYFWLDVAASGKVTASQRKEATARRNTVASHLTPTELSRVQERVHEWLKIHPDKM